MREALERLIEEWRDEAAGWVFPEDHPEVLRKCADALEVILDACPKGEVKSNREWREEAQLARQKILELQAILDAHPPRGSVTYDH